MTYFWSTIIVVISLYLPVLGSFSTSFPSTYTQCADYTISFTGQTATPPFNLLLVPLSSATSLSIDIPDTAWNPNTLSGTFTTKIPFNQATQFLAIMRDTLGRSTGGISAVYTVQPSEDFSCISDNANIPSSNVFSFSPSPPIQCQDQTIQWNLPAPVVDDDQGTAFLSTLNITGFIPNGMAFTLDSPSGDNFDSLSGAVWNVNIPSGQQFVLLFQYLDNSGTLTQETTSLQDVQPSTNGDTSCLREGSPSSTAAPNFTTATGSSVGVISGGTNFVPTASQSVAVSDTTSDSSSQPFGGLNKQVLIAIIVGSILGACILVGLAFFLVSRIRKRREKHMEEGKHYNLQSQRSSSPESTVKHLTVDPSAPLGLSLSVSSHSPSETTTHTQSFYNSQSPPSTPYSDPNKPKPRPLFGRSKIPKDAVASVASFGNRGTLSVAFPDNHDPPSLPIPTYSLPFQNAPQGQHPGEQRQVRIRYLDLDNSTQQSA